MFKKITNWFKSFTCHHRWISDGYIEEEFKPGFYMFHRIWTCGRCGKVRIGQFKNKESLWTRQKMKKQLKKERK